MGLFKKEIYKGYEYRAALMKGKISVTGGEIECVLPIKGCETALHINHEGYWFVVQSEVELSNEEVIALIPEWCKKITEYEEDELYYDFLRTYRETDDSCDLSLNDYIRLRFDVKYGQHRRIVCIVDTFDDKGEFIGTKTVKYLDCTYLPEHFIQKTGERIIQYTITNVK